MIDQLPLDLFASDGDAAEAPRCGWCGANAPIGAACCASCGARLTVADAAPPAESSADPHAQPDSVECQWCDAPVGPQDERCPVCGGVTRGDAALLIPGLSVPLSEEAIAERYGPSADAVTLAPWLLLEVLSALLGDLPLPD